MKKKIEILNIDDVAKLTKFSKSRIYFFVYTKQIPNYRRGPRSKIFFVKSEVMEWLLRDKMPTINNTIKKMTRGYFNKNVANCNALKKIKIKNN